MSRTTITCTTALGRLLDFGLRVLYTIVEWLLKSAPQDNCAAALNGLCGIEQIRPIKCPAVTLRASYSTLL